jgi:hypothetical protein
MFVFFLFLSSSLLLVGYIRQECCLLGHFR